MSALWPIARGAAVAALALVLAGGCSRKPRRVVLPAELTVPTLTVGGTAPTLSWGAVPGAAEYAVTVVGEEGTAGLWIWTGPGTKVDYGTPSAAAQVDTTEFAPVELPARKALAVRPGGRYRWLVLAFDAQGRSLASSDVAHFTAPGTPPAPAGKATPAAPAAGGRPGRQATTSPVPPQPVANVPHACDLMPPARLKELLGQEPKPPQRMGGGTRTVCMYGPIVLAVEAAAHWLPSKQMTAGIAPVVDYPGVGEAAYWQNLQGYAAQLVVLQGPVFVAVTLPMDEAGEKKTQELSSVIAKAMLSAAAK